MKDTDPQADTLSPHSGPHAHAHTSRPAQVVYGLYLAGLVTASATALIGIIVAYVYRKEAPDWLSEHYRFQIRTFWIGILYSLLLFSANVFVMNGWLWLPLVLWVVLRCVRGLRSLSRKAAPARINHWLY